MSEFRQDRTSGNWVIVAPQRGRRPQMRAPDEQPPPRPRFDPSCPFCPGNEAQLVGIISQTASPGAPGWQMRVVPNKFPAVMAAPPPIACEDHVVRPAVGVHEVVIESPWHDANLATMEPAALAGIVSLYRARLRAAFDTDGIAAAVLYRNYGRAAGASLAHPHAQIVALPLVPTRIAAASEWMKAHHRAHGTCAMCEELTIERRSGARIVDENDAFTVLVPYAAEHACELWVVPRSHQASFTDLSDEALPAFATMVHRALVRLRIALSDPPYNFVIDTAPKPDRTAPYWHWRLRIVPNVAIWGGFELGSGMPINPSRPEDDAQMLRAAPADFVG